MPYVSLFATRSKLTCLQAVLWLVLIASLHCSSALAQQKTADRLKLDTTVIQQNKDLPKILYLVPWQDVTEKKNKSEQRLVLHSLFGDLFDPLTPAPPRSEDKP